MSKADIALVILLLLGAWSGYRKGFLMALFSLAAILLGAWGAYQLMDAGQAYLSKEFGVTGNYVPYVAFLVIFLIILIGVKLAGSIVRSAIEGTTVGEIDQWMGAGLGLIRYTLVISFLLVALNRLDLGLPERWTSGSVVFPVVEGTAPWVTDLAGGSFPDFRELMPGK
ncbi:MAG: CvpA family protein [Bacteroidota bacterium]